MASPYHPRKLPLSTATAGSITYPEAFAVKMITARFTASLDFLEVSYLYEF